MKNIFKLIILILINFIIIYLIIELIKEININYIGNYSKTNGVEYEELSTTLNDKTLLENSKSNIEKTENEKISEEYLGFKVCAKLEIEKINFSSFVLEDFSYDAMNTCITKLCGPNPNENGNFCIIGHNYKLKNMFSNLNNLNIGDEIYLIDNSNGKIRYLVYDIYIVNSNNINPIKQENLEYRELTLITCVNYTDNRLIVKAKEN